MKSASWRSPFRVASGWMSSRELIASEHDFLEDFTVRPEAVEELVRRIEETPIAASLALADFVPDADEYQGRVIGAKEATVRMLAPAGSGKTQTIINRVIARVREGVRPSRVLVLTFDNSAANSLREKQSDQMMRLSRADGIDPLGGLTISTLNAFGYRLLKENFPDEYRAIIGGGRDHRFVRDLLDLLKERSRERHRLLPGNLRTGFYLDFFALFKNQMFDPRDLPPQTFADFILAAKQAEPFFVDVASVNDDVKLLVQAIAWLYQKYEEKLRGNKLMDFDDQKLRAYTSLTENLGALSALQSRFSEVIVDEFQDINRLDFELIKLIAVEANLLVTGDDDQAIYGFRGCTPEYIINLEHHLGRAVKSYELQINYRCPPNIVKHADLLIRHNTFRVPKNPIAYRTDHSVVKVVSTQAAGVEAQSIVAFIRRVRAAQPSLEFSDFAVLYRTNAQSLPIQVEFILNDVPYLVRDQDNIIANDALGRLLALLRVKVAINAGRQPRLDDQVRAVTSYFRYLDVRQQASVRTVLSQAGDFEEGLSSDLLAELLPKLGKSNIVDAFDALIYARSLGDALEVIADRFHGISGMVGSLEDALDQRVPLGEVFDLAAHFGGSLANFITTMERAMDRARATKAGKAQSGVALLTYFKSKGRQWHTVIMTTCNEGLIPHRRAVMDGLVEEERRLFYVAMTRPTANLLISYVSSALGKRVAPSRFIEESGLM